MPARKLREAACQVHYQTTDIHDMMPKIWRARKEEAGHSGWHSAYSDRITKRTTRAMRSLIQTAADAIVAAFVCDTVLVAKINRRTIGMRLVPGDPDDVESKALVFKTWAGDASEEDEKAARDAHSIDAEADFDGMKVSFDVADFGTVTLTIPRNGPYYPDYEKDVVVTAAATTVEEVG